MALVEAPALDWRREREINRLPSVETQLVVWIDALERGEAGRSVTLKRGGFKVYVRRAVRWAGDKKLTMLVIANVTVPPHLQRRGWFTAFRRLAECVHPWEATSYESVINPHLRDNLMRSGLTPDGEGGFYVVKR